MPQDDEMTIDERPKYLRRMRSRYLQADKKERGHLLDDMQHMTGLARKTLIRRLHGDLTRHLRPVALSLQHRMAQQGYESSDALAAFLHEHLQAVMKATLMNAPISL